MHNQEIKVELTLNGKKVKVGHKFLDSIVTDIPECKENKKIFELLAISTNNEVRKWIARSEYLNKKTIELLLNDKSTEVVDNILSNSDINKLITQEQLEKIFKINNTKLLVTIAKNLDEFKNVNQCRFIKKLSSHPSSEVRYGLFTYSVSSLISNNILKQLSNDDDFDVAFEAKKELKDRLES